MPIKVYSDEQRKEVRIKLLKTGLNLYSQNGIRSVKLTDILKVVGISKPFFYTFYSSLAEFVLSVLEYQWEQFPILIEAIDKRMDLSWEEKIREILIHFIHYNKYGFLVMTQLEEVWLYQRVDKQRYKVFMDRQKVFFEDLLRKWEIPKDKCNPKVLSNMVVMMIVTHNSAKESLPFIFTDDLEETAKAHVESIIAYLKLLKENKRDI